MRTDKGDSKKRLAERKIFNLVYSNHDKFKVKHKDKPDFWVENQAGEEFGVEVTELFSDDTTARLYKIPNYLDEILDKNNYRHKDDIEKLRITTIEIIKQDGISERTGAIVRTIPAKLEFLQVIKNRLIDKNKSIEDYKDDLKHVNLIIKENSSILSVIKHKDFYDFFYEDFIISELLKSKFREIYLVAWIEQQQLILPLKAILFVSRVMFFDEVLARANVKELPDKEYYKWFTEFLTYQGFTNVYILDKDDEVQIIYGNTGCIIKNSSEILLRDYSDYSIPKDASPIEKGSKSITDEIEKIVNELNGDFVFEAEMGLEAIINKET